MVDDLPITGLCIVEQTCPPGYLMVGLVVLHEPFSLLNAFKFQHI